MKSKIRIFDSLETALKWQEKQRAKGWTVAENIRRIWENLSELFVVYSWKFDGGVI